MAASDAFCNPNEWGLRNETNLHRRDGACRRWKDDAAGGDALPGRCDAAARQSGPSGRLFRYGRAGTCARHYDLFQAGGADAAGGGDYLSRYAGACGLFCRNGADAAGAGLCAAACERHGRRAEPHQNALAAAPALSDSDHRFCQQDGPARQGTRRHLAGAAAGAFGKLRGV